MTSKNQKDKLYSELEELMDKLLFHLQETSDYSAAAYQVVCEIGRNDKRHLPSGKGLNQNIEEHFVLVRKIGEVRRQVEKLLKLSGMERIDVKSKS